MTITSNITGLVTGDNRPITEITLTKSNDASAIDLSDANTSVILRCRPAGDEAATPVEIATTKPNGGSDGKVQLVWGTLLDTAAPGTWEAEVVIRYGVTDIHTIYEKIKFKIRARFGS